SPAVQDQGLRSLVRAAYFVEGERFDPYRTTNRRHHKRQPHAACYPRTHGTRQTKRRNHRGEFCLVLHPPTCDAPTLLHTAFDGNKEINMSAESPSKPGAPFDTEVHHAYWREKYQD